MDPLPVFAHGDVAPDVVAAISALVRNHRSLDDVLAWAATLAPPRSFEDIVRQDEYTHDVLVRIEEGRYLVYDVT